MDLVEVEIDGVLVHELTKQHVVNLRERGGRRLLPIWIGPEQAHTISTKLAGLPSERPLTHDLVVRLSDALAGRFERLVIHSLAPFEEGKTQGVFIASLFVRDADGKTSEIDCRPSDGIAIAVRTGIPTFVSADIFERSAVTPS
jgi:bifunctional DNase/RNase